MTSRPPTPKFHLVDAVTGLPGELLAAIWHLGLLRASVTITGRDLERARGYGVEIFQADTGGAWQLIAVNHPWVEPDVREENQDDGPIEHRL